MENSNLQFTKKLLACQAVVGYRPLQDEPSPAYSLSRRFIVSPDKSTDPVDMAKRVSVMFAETSVCLYIPGRAFDKYGTRHGRGGGWYDRFLASVPFHWMRVGLCFESNFSHIPLKRETWDQSMDWIGVQKTDGMDYYETKVRGQ